MSWFCCLGSVAIVVLIYKALDWLIRRVYIGKYDERYILITGCDMGFGNLLAKRLDGLGCHVFAGCLTEAGCASLRTSCSPRLQAIQMDVSRQDSVRNAFEIVKAALPAGKGLWGVMNNAGIVGATGPQDWLTIQDYKNCNAVNLYGLIDVTMTFLPLVKLAHGRIVNTASVYGRYSLSVGNPYCISKYGVEVFTDGLRRAMGIFKVKAILIEPGLHKTNITALQNLASPAEKCWNQASQETKEEYGEEYYKYLVSQSGLGAFEKMSSSRVEDVVDAYHHALLGLFPRARYVVGKDAKFIWLPLQWMPEWLGDYLLTKFDPNQPLPAALKKKDN